MIIQKLNENFKCINFLILSQIAITNIYLLFTALLYHKIQKLKKRTIFLQLKYVSVNSIELSQLSPF